MTNDRDAERLVLAGIFMADDPRESLRVIDLPVEAFSNAFHRDAWVAINDLFEDGETIHLANVRFRLSDNHPTLYGGDARGACAAQLAKLYDGTPRHIYTGDAVRRLREIGYRRALEALSSDFQKQVADSALSPSESILAQHRALQDARQTWGSTQSRGSAPAMVERLREFYGTSQETAVKTGFTVLDDAIGALHPGTVMTVLARPGIGKSNFGLNLISNWLAQDAEFGTAFFSLEMPESLVTSRICRMVENTSEAQLKQTLDEGKSPSEFLKAAGHRLIVSDRGGLTIAALEEEFRRAETTLGLPIKAAVVDYLQLMRSPHRASPYERISMLTAELKEFAKRRDVFLVLLSQVGRGDAGGEGFKCPTAEAARDSGTIEENADYMLGLWRPDTAKNPPPGTEGKVNYRVLKGRNGGMGEQAALHFDTASLRLEESMLPVRG